MFTGKKVRLREYRKEDIQLAVDYINDPEVKKFMLTVTPFPIPTHSQEKFIEGLITDNLERYAFAIETLEDGKYIGGCGLNNLDWKNSVVTVGIFIGDKNYWGKGYGTDAMKTFINFIFNELNVNKVKLATVSFNERAIRCYEKCGFKQEGVLRQEIFKGGKYHDEIIMSILKEDYFGVKNVEVEKSWKAIDNVKLAAYDEKMNS